MGASAETIAQARAQLAAQPTELPTLDVLRCNAYAVAVFAAMRGQWLWTTAWVRGAPVSRRVALRLEALPVVLAALRGHAHRVPLAELLPQLEVLSETACDTWASA